MIKRIYKCAICGEEFIGQDDDEWNEEIALAELKERFGDVPPEQKEVACDGCYVRHIEPMLRAKGKIK
jgi:DNA-directed RNA polymerase subunit RPC12/RpoP